MHSLGISLGDVSGTYLGYVDIDRERNWDIRHVPHLGALPREDRGHGLSLPSDSCYRPDIVHMHAGDDDRAREETVALFAGERELKVRRKRNDYS